LASKVIELAIGVSQNSIKISCTIDTTSSINFILNIRSRNLSPINVSNIVNIVGQSHNKIQLNNKYISWKSAKNMVISSVYHNLTNVDTYSFEVTTHPPKTPSRGALEHPHPCHSYW
jgi:hypothetical protein